MSQPSLSGAAVSAKTTTRAAWILFAAVGLVGFSFFLLSVRGSGVSRNSPPPIIAADSPAPGEDPVVDPVRDHLASLGLQMADHDLAVSLFRDPRHDQELIVFVDARDGLHYESGHIPGAYPMESSHLERDLPILLPICLTAEIVVVYCNGENCNDSESAALTLREIGVTGEKLFVYAGGTSEWQRQGLPIQVGRRQNNNLEQP